MKILFFAMSLLSVSRHAYGISRSCDPALSSSAKYHDGVNPSHEIKISDKTVVVGGVGEKHSPDMDHLAIQRGLLFCAPGIIECFKNQKSTLPVEFVVSFQLNPHGEVAKASDFKFFGKGGMTPSASECLVRIWSATSYGLIIKEMKAVSMPVKIR